MEYGYSVVWVAGKHPCFISPGGYILTLLQVDRNIPYLHRGTPSSNLTDGNIDEIDEALEEAGLCRWNGKLALNLDAAMPETAAPAVLYSVESAEDMGLTPEEIARDLRGNSDDRSRGFLAADESFVPPPPAAVFPRPERWRSPFAKCLTCTPIPGQEPVHVVGLASPPPTPPLLTPKSSPGSPLSAMVSPQTEAPH